MCLLRYCFLFKNKLFKDDVESLISLQNSISDCGFHALEKEQYVMIIVTGFSEQATSLLSKLSVILTLDCPTFLILLLILKRPSKLLSWDVALFFFPSPALLKQKKSTFFGFIS